MKNSVTNGAGVPSYNASTTSGRSYSATSYAVVGIYGVAAYKGIEAAALAALA